MGWVDTHCHLQLDARPPDLLIERAVDVDWMVVPGVDADSSRRAIDLAGAHPGRLIATAGLHPHEASAWPEQEAAIVVMAEAAGAVGETGLDYYRNLSGRLEQLGSFRAHVELAMALGKPLVVHCRDAFADVHQVLESAGAGPRAVLHCWTGGTRWTRRFLDLGVTFSFAGPIAFETGETIRRAAALVPPDRAMVETDTPYLSPPPYRGEPNEPARVALVGGALAEVWGATPEAVAAATTATAGRVFGR